MTSILIFICGAAVLIYSAEKLIGYLVGVATGLRISIFLLAIIFTGIEFDDMTLGVALNLEGLGGVALGIVFGTAISMSGVVLALAAIITPVKIRVPRDYIAIFALAPFVMIVFTLIAPLTIADAIILIALFVLFICYVAIRESRGDRPVFRDAEMYEAYAAVRASTKDTAVLRDAGSTMQTEKADRGGPLPDEETSRHLSAAVPFAAAREHSGWVTLGLAVLALAGLVIGAGTTSIGTKGILQTYGLEGTLFGATIATVVLTIEDIFLTVEPTRKGAPRWAWATSSEASSSRSQASWVSPSSREASWSAQTSSPGTCPHSSC